MGKILLNRYHLQARLGAGGMGVVYRAHDALLDRDVAIKILTGPGLGSSGRARLLNEARAVARLNHPNIIAIYDVAEAGAAQFESDETEAGASPADQGSPFIVMELVRGESLDRVSLSSWQEILPIAIQICVALEHAHSNGIIHRDLKPENVCITPSGSVKLMDFGLARNISIQESEPMLIGTVLYMAPEQARGLAIDLRADLYALGVLLYEALTGRPPFTGDDPLAVIAQHLNDTPAPPGELRADLPPALNELILKLLAKNPDDRFASAGEVKAILLALAGQDRPPGSPSTPLPTDNLPAEITSFIGREKEIGEVRTLLGGARLLTLTGAGGTGKTRLALQTAGQLRADFPDGVWLVDMAPLTESDLAAQSVATVLSVREQPGAPLTRRIADAIRPKRMLLIFDNCEHLIDAVAELVETLLQACPALKILATSREALGIAGETTYRVPSLSLPASRRQGAIDTATALRSEAVRLFVERAAAVRPGFELTPGNTAAVLQICTRLDGVPLALELAAARVRALGVEQIAARLDDRFSLLTGGSRTALPRQQTLRALIDWSWDLLSPDEKLLLRRISVFLGGATLEAVEFVCGSPAPPPDAAAPAADVLELLTHLVDKSLIIVEEYEGDTRYRMLETIRQYAREKLLEAGADEVKGIRGRQLEYFLKFAQERQPALRSGAQLSVLSRLELEHENLRASLKWSVAPASPVRSSETALKLAGALAVFWYLRGHWSEGRTWLRTALDEPQPETAAPSLELARAKALAGLAWLMDENGEEIPLYEESLALFRKLGHPTGTAFCLRGLSTGLLYGGENERAAAYLDEALALYRSASSAWGIGLVQFTRGWYFNYLDDLVSAEAAWTDSLAAFNQCGDRWGIAVTHIALSFTARWRGDYARAAALTEVSLACFRELGDKAGIASSLSRLGNVAYRRGEYTQAVVLIEEGIPLRRELGELYGLSSDFAQLGLIAAYQGDTERAKAWIEQSIDLAGEIDDANLMALETGYLGTVHYFAGELDRAGELWRQCLEQQRQNNDRLGMAYAMDGLGLLALRRGDAQAAEELLEESQRLNQEIGDKHYIAAGYKDLGLIARARGDVARAIDLERQALALYRDLGERQGQAETLVHLAAAIAEALAAPTQARQPVERDRLMAAARLWAAGETLRKSIGALLPVVERPDFERDLQVVRQELGAAFDEAWSAGQGLPIDQAIAEALALSSIWQKSTL